MFVIYFVIVIFVVIVIEIVNGCYLDEPKLRATRRGVSSVQIIFQYLVLGVVVLLLLFLSSVVVTRQLFSLCRQPDEGGVWCKLTQMHRRLHHRNQFRKLKLEMHKSCFYQIFNLYAGEEIPEIERLG